MCRDHFFREKNTTLLERFHGYIVQEFREWSHPLYQSYLTEPPDRFLSSIALWLSSFDVILNEEQQSKLRKDLLDVQRLRATG